MIKERIRRLEDNLVILEDFKNKTSLKDLLKDKVKEWALRYGILECIQEVVDISCALVSSNNLGSPKFF